MFKTCQLTRAHQGVRNANFFGKFCACTNRIIPYITAKIYHDIGLLYISEKLFKSAGECFEQSLRCMENSATSDKYLLATILQNIGAVYNYMKYFRKAISFHRRSADVYGEYLVISESSFNHLVFDNIIDEIIQFNHLLGNVVKWSGRL